MFPSEVRIGYHVYKVARFKKMPSGCGGNLGCVHYDTRTIHILRADPLDEVEVLFHECLHVICNAGCTQRIVYALGQGAEMEGDVLRANMEEEFVHHAAIGLTQILIDNPQLMDHVRRTVTSVGHRLRRTSRRKR